jgi:hypothetical protein
MVKIVSTILITLLALISVSACTPIPEPEYASAITEEMLQALSQDDYATFTQRFDENIEKIMPEKKFHELAAEVEARAGSYQSKEFVKAEDSGFSFIVYYDARFTEEPDDVLIEIRFKELDGEIRVTYFNIDSPKLRGN